MSVEMYVMKIMKRACVSSPLVHLRLNLFSPSSPRDKNISKHFYFLTYLQSTFRFYTDKLCGKHLWKFHVSSSGQRLACLLDETLPHVFLQISLIQIN